MRFEAGRIFNEEIEKLQENNRRRNAKWEEDLDIGRIKKNAPPPPILRYDVFDWNMLRMSKKPNCCENEPSEGHGGEIAWIN